MSDNFESPVRLSDYPTDNSAPVLTKEQAPLWDQAEIDETRWNKYFPYQLLVVRAVPTQDGNEVSYERVPGFMFTLPIPPQELSVDMPIATTIQATLNGIVEIHAGAPFRDIVLNGTTGVAPQRKAARAGRDTDAFGEAGRLGSAIFAGTTQALTRLRTATIAASDPNGTAIFPNIQEPTTGPGENQIPANSTGYYQYQLLERFIESYVLLKSRNRVDQTFGDTRQLRLALAVWKDNAVYLCAGVKLGKRKSAGDPFLINYSLMLKAWARIQLKNTVDGAYSHQFIARNPNLLARAYNRFRAARDIVNGATDVIQSVITDATSTVTDALREVSLFMKSVAGLSQTLSDFPDTITKEALPLIVRQWSTLRDQFEGKIPPELDEEFRQAQGSNKLSVYENEGLTSRASAQASTNVDANTAVGSRSQALSTIYDALSPSVLSFKPSTIKRINDERDRVRAFTRLDFEERRDELQSIAEQFAFAIGAGDSVYAQTYGRAEPSTSGRTPTAAEFDILFALNEALILLDHLAASGQINPQAPTSLEYVAGLAERSGIAFKVPTSKFAIPFPYGFTLERLARRYLGDANRWHEIAVLNGLRNPYVDEKGFKLTLLTNGDASQVSVSDAKQLYQGQTVWISATGVARTKRHIDKIDQISPTNYLLTLDGLPNLQIYTVGGKAVLEAFLPGTVNSQQVLYIPSNNVAGEDPETIAVPGVDVHDPYLTVGGIDLLLTPDGDIAMTPDGDTRLAYGLTNIVQTVRLALSTPRGSLLQHPNYGLNIPVGSSTADLSAQDLLKAAKDLFANDPTFTGVRSASVLVEGNTVFLTIEVGIAGASQFLPITVAVKR